VAPRLPKLKNGKNQINRKTKSQEKGHFTGGINDGAEYVASCVRSTGVQKLTNKEPEEVRKGKSFGWDGPPSALVAGGGVQLKMRLIRPHRGKRGDF